MEQTRELIHGTSDLNTISDINVTPFIDVMLVLLIIFMVTAPLMMGGVKINLPKTDGTPMAHPENPVIVSLDAESRIYVDQDEIGIEDRANIFKKLAIDSESGEVYVRGDREVKYSQMMDLMTELGQAGFARVTLVTSVLDGNKETKKPEVPEAISNHPASSAVISAHETTPPASNQ